MAFIEWADELSVGFEEVDKDHQRLVEIVNEFHETIALNKDRDELEEALEELIEYTGWHFRHEERLMQESEYDGLEEHQKIHQDLVAQALAIQTKLADGDESVLDVLMPFLKDWLTKHILETDMAMGTYLAAQE
ncbi:bacteriohemerythrin [Pseudodesulfovibrio sp.]|nr:bacteriohemerythrin [Pseudodesulfovibrio sp.]